MFKIFLSIVFTCFFVFTLYTAIKMNKIIVRTMSWRNLSKEEKNKVKRYFLCYAIAFVLLLLIALIAFMVKFR